ncbi:putative bifunctional diguanylate cyclase/phosphodiesterase [Succinimonas sp.]|uniref:putative bifunctional diguanylate cyclase/phosphodiesterase n=1 Tax=Succinimonas sp. TaxID=1936151 RepID=UPI00386E0F70
MIIAVTCSLVLLLALIVCARILVIQKKTIRALRKQNAEFITLCDLIQAPIWFKDSDLRLTWVNQFYALMFDKDRSYFVGLTDRDIAPKKLVEGYVRDDMYVLESKNVYRYRENEKAGLWFESVKFPLVGEDGNSYGVGGIAFNVTAIKKSENMLHKLVHSDYLTGIPNRLSLSVEGAKYLSESDAAGQKLAFILVDIKNFLSVNKMHGHVVGDEILKITAERIKNALSDFAAFVGRFSGDQFLVMLKNCNDAEVIDNAVASIQNEIGNQYQIFGGAFAVSVSIGISIFPEHGMDYETLIRNADVALLAAKRSFDQNVMTYSEVMGMGTNKRVLIENKLSGAVARGEFYLYYQPKVCEETKRIKGIEALIRWNSPDFGKLMPNDFIPIAEDSDVIVTISDWVLKTALEQNLSWKEKFGEMYPMAVNLSRRQISKPDFLTKIVNLLEELNYPPKFLELELRETVLSHADVRILKDFGHLREMGVKISVDDFGTGLINITNLKTFPLDCIKIDKCFISNISKSQEKQQIVDAIISLAKTFKLSLIAEGVETGIELDYLRQSGIADIQGFYFAEPLNVEAMTDYIEHKKNSGESN